MQSFLVVPMQKRHLDALEDLERRCFSRPWSRAGLEAELQSNTARFLVCETEKSVVAGYVGSHLVCGEGYVDNVAVSPDFRRQGVARLLLRSLSEICKRERAEFLTLEVRESNQPARRLYEGLGFQEAGRRRGFYTQPTEDALLLTKRFDF